MFAENLVTLHRGVLSLWQRYAEKCATQKIVKDANRTTNIIPEGYPEDEFEKTE